MYGTERKTNCPEDSVEKRKFGLKRQEKEKKQKESNNNTTKERSKRQQRLIKRE